MNGGIVIIDVVFILLMVEFGVIFYDRIFRISTLRVFREFISVFGF